MLSAHTSFTPLLSAGQPSFPASLGSPTPQAAWEVLLDRHGPAGIEQVNGDFAFAARLADGRTLAAVDRFAIRSLCYRVDAEGIHFAERADQLADSASALDPQALYDYLYFHYIPSPRTIYRGVLRLPPGHYALYENGRLTVAPYWVARFEPAAAASFGALREEFHRTLEASVTRQLDGGKPATFLSGGTDSSTVAGMLAKVAGRASTYSIGFEAEGYDEMEYARIAARHFKTEHHEYYVTPADLVRSIPRVAAHYDQPFGNSSALPAFYCAQMAREDGVGKILAGDGGDELFGGNTRYAKQKVFGLYETVPEGLRTGLLQPLLDQPWAHGTPGLSKLASYIRQARVPMPDRLQTYNQLERLGVAEVLSEGFLAQVDRDGPHVQQRAVWAQPQGAGLVDRMLAFDWRYTLAECDLPKVCGTTALAGLQVGFPMLDDQLLAFSQRLPADYKLKGLKLRWFFKEALRGFLPDEIITKKKQGFGLPFGVWATRDAALKKLGADSVDGLVARGLVRPEFARSLLNERLAEHPGYYGEMIWILMMLEQWLRAHAPDYRV